MEQWPVIRLERFLRPVAALAVVIALAGCAATNPDRRSAAQQIEDTVTISRVKTALLESDDTDGTRIDVEVFRGRVQLDGAVASESERDAATRIAEDVEGVRSVENNLELDQAGAVSAQ
jgi:osmotically-inducible protein OsmY